MFLLLTTFQVSLTVFQLNYLGIRLVVGMAIFYRRTSFFNDPSHELEETLPSMYELPGEHAEPIDATILETVRRETFEETQLVVKQAIPSFGGFEYTSNVQFDLSWKWRSRRRLSLTG